ncbi:MAG: OmpA family protein [Gemmatimonadota bacterium]
MRIRTLYGVVALILAAVVTLAATPADTEAQFRRLRDTAKRALENEAVNQVDRLIRDAIRCVIDDPACYEGAQSEDGEDVGGSVIFTDANGEVILDDEGAPITDREAAAARAGVDLSTETTSAEGVALEEPGEGVWANYDFVPGERILAVTDFLDDEIGDFPRELEYIRGMMEIVEWQGERLLRAVSVSQFKVPLPDGEFPERLTIELDLYGDGSGAEVLVVFDEPPAHGQPKSPHFNFGYWVGSGIMESWHTPLSTVEDSRMHEGFVTARITIADRNVRAYINEKRISNVPSVSFPRGDAIYFVMYAQEDQPVYIRNIRIAEGGRALYEKLADVGRVATQGILFDTDSDRLRPESTPTLDEIGQMLEEHPDLQLTIEGHTDSTGDETHNQELSERRAESVTRFLIDRYGIAEDRLIATGFGESKPVDSNDTPAGRQNNRRVELVRRGESSR